MKNEYLNVLEISKKCNMTTRNVRRIIHALITKHNDLMIRKDANNNWLVHELLLSKFKRKRKAKSKYFAITIDPCGNHTCKEINEIMRYVFEQVGGEDLEINYSIEQKKANGKNHLHCFVATSQKRKLLTYLKLGFSKISYKESSIYDLTGWVDYITKNGNTIFKLNN